MVDATQRQCKPRVDASSPYAGSKKKNGLFREQHGCSSIEKETKKKSGSIVTEEMNAAIVTPKELEEMKKHAQNRKCTHYTIIIIIKPVRTVKKKNVKNKVE